MIAIVSPIGDPVVKSAGNISERIHELYDDVLTMVQLLRQMIYID